ncbi:carbohydrate kinase family protein, partial [Candidatus Woesearchaeota archaeon]|nr:carbohydrate kinase family protein [Candidatus Woesearchaeota archaeon]
MFFNYDVLCIGSATLDSFLTVETPLAKIKLGDKVIVSAIETHSGGGATNSAVALAKFGLKVKVLTKLGNDHDGNFITQELKSHKANNICLHHSHKHTDTAVILDYVKDKDRVIYVHKGASDDLTEHDFKLSPLNTKWIYLATLMGTSFKTGESIAKYASKQKILLLFNPSLYLAQKGKTELKHILSAAAVLVLNLEEAQALLKNKTSSMEQLLKQLHQLGPKTVVITNGPKRLYAYHKDYIHSLFPPKVNVVHTAGAGDAFTAALLGAMIKSYKFEDCLRIGQANASSVIQAVGVKHKLLNEKEALKMAEQHKLKVETH